MGSALLFLTVYLIYPILNTAYISFLGRSSKEFAGLGNYWYVFTNADMLGALKNNLLWLVLFTSITVSLGVAIAVLTDRVRYEAAAKALVFLPMAISFVAASVIWRFMFEFRPAGTDQIGLMNALLSNLLGFKPVAWLVNTRVNNFALIGVGIWVWTGFCTVILSAGLKAIPVEILEAARIDGASEWRIFTSLVVPLSMPIIATLFLLAFQFHWNNFLWQLIVTTDEKMYTVPVGLAMFRSAYEEQYALKMAASSVSIIPIAAVFLVTQRFFIEGMTKGAVKG